MFITPEELLAGRELTYDVEVPADLLEPSLDGTSAPPAARKKVRLRPLTMHDVQLIAKAAKQDEVLTSVLMIQKSLVEPQLKQANIMQMPSGLVRFLMDRINRISGLSTSDDELKEIINAPIVKAFFMLAREFHWTPEQVKELTVGQIVSYLELLNQQKRSTA